VTGRICNECGHRLPRETEQGSPLLMAHLADEHPERLNTSLRDRMEAVIRAAEMNGSA